MKWTPVASQYIARLPRKTKIEVYTALNCWQWHPALGVEPDWWNCKGMGREKRRMITPIMREIKRHVSEKELREYWHVVELGRTKEEFEQWWRAQSIEEDQQIRRIANIVWLSIIAVTAILGFGPLLLK